MVVINGLRARVIIASSGPRVLFWKINSVNVTGAGGTSPV